MQKILLQDWWYTSRPICPTSNLPVWIPPFNSIERYCLVLSSQHICLARKWLHLVIMTRTARIVMHPTLGATTMGPVGHTPCSFCNWLSFFAGQCGKLTLFPQTSLLNSRGERQKSRQGNRWNMGDGEGTGGEKGVGIHPRGPIYKISYDLAYVSSS